MSILINILIAVAVVGAAMILISRKMSFGAQKTKDYKDGPIFNIRERFNGPIQCEGIIYGPMGRVTSRFIADFEASWEGNVGTMVEKFHYDSGNIQDRVWTLTLSNDGAIKAEAPDVIGAGTGRQEGSAVKLNYDIKLTEDAGGHVLHVTDWMYLMSNGTIMNRSQFRKFGIKVAEMVATMRPKGEIYAGE